MQILYILLKLLNNSVSNPAKNLILVIKDVSPIFNNRVNSKLKMLNTVLISMIKTIYKVFSSSFDLLINFSKNVREIIKLTLKSPMKINLSLKNFKKLLLLAPISWPLSVYTASLSVFKNLSLKMSNSWLYSMLVRWYVVITTTILLRVLCAPTVYCEDKKDPSFREKYLYWLDTKTIVIITLVIVSGVIIYKLDEYYTREIEKLLDDASEMAVKAGEKISSLTEEIKDNTDRMDYVQGIGFSDGYQKAVSDMKEKYNPVIKQSFEKGVNFAKRVHEQELSVKYEEGYLKGYQRGVTDTTTKLNTERTMGTIPHPNTPAPRNNPNAFIDSATQNITNVNPSSGPNEIPITFIPDVPL
jgi:hypothetical protein